MPCIFMTRFFCGHAVRGGAQESSEEMAEDGESDVSGLASCVWTPVCLDLVDLQNLVEWGGDGRWEPPPRIPVTTRIILF